MSSIPNSPPLQCAGLCRLSFMGWLNCGIGLFDEARRLKYGQLLTAASCPSGVDVAVHLFLVDMSSSEPNVMQLRSCSIVYMMHEESLCSSSNQERETRRKP